MNVVFVDISRDFYDKNWIYALTPVLKARGIQPEYVGIHSARIRPGEIELVARARPDLVLYSAFTADLPKVVALDAAIKQRVRCHSLVGGPGPTFDWGCHKDSTLDGICVGEGEVALGDYIDSGFSGGRNIILRGKTSPNQMADLVSLQTVPLPDRKLVYDSDPVLRSMSAKQFMVGRGCPYQCTYCFNHAFNRMFKDCGPIIRQRSVDRVVEEIREVRSQYPLTLVSFQDDTFIVRKAWLLEFARKFPREIGLPFSCNVRANLVDEEVAQALSEAGCVAVSWSIESGNDRLRNDVLCRNMSREAILNAGRLLHKHGIKQRLANVIGIPGETIEELHETVRLNIAIRPQIATANIFVPYPGLQLTEYAVRGGYLSAEALRNLPRDIFTRSVLNFSELHRRYLRKTSYLFPFLIRFPWLFEMRWVRRTVYALPWLLLRVLYEAWFLYTCMRLYRIGGGLRIRGLILVRYLRNLL